MFQIKLRSCSSVTSPPSVSRSFVTHTSTSCNNRMKTFTSCTCFKKELPKQVGQWNSSDHKCFFSSTHQAPLNKDCLSHLDKVLVYKPVFLKKKNPTFYLHFYINGYASLHTLMVLKSFYHKTVIPQFKMDQRLSIWSNMQRRNMTQ